MYLRVVLSSEIRLVGFQLSTMGRTKEEHKFPKLVPNEQRQYVWVVLFAN